MSKNTGTSELINYFDLGVNGDVGISGSLTLDTIANAVIDTDKFLVSDNGIIKYRTGAELLSDIGVAGNYVTIDTAQTITGIKTFSGTNLQLESSGSADATILRNTSGVTGSTSNSNTIGFNGVNNIFVSTQNRGGFILGFNNSVQNREYTLPDASGTIALTSSIPANPVGGTGTTNYLPKFTGASTIGNSLLYDNGTNVYLGNVDGGNKALVVNGTGATVATIYFDSTAKTYGLYQTGTQSNFLTGNLLVGTITDNGARLQVSGDSTFSGKGTFNDLVTTTSVYKIVQASVARGGLYTYNQVTGSGTDYSIGLFSETEAFIVTGGTTTKRLTIDSTGAATFSSSVECRKLYVSPGGGAGSGSDGIANIQTASTTLGETSELGLLIKNNGTSGYYSQIGFGYAESKVGAVIAGLITNGGGATSSALVFGTRSTTVGSDAPTERMRITSGGFLKASNTGGYIAAQSFHELRTGDNARALLITNASTTLSQENGLDIIFSNASPNNATSKFIVCEDSSAFRFIVYSNGNVANYNNSYGSISDIKLKENIEDATPKLDDLMKVKVRNYNLIGDDKKQIGVIAQELEEVFPAMIDESEDFEEMEVPKLDEEGNEILNEEGEVVTEKQRVSKGTTTKSVKYSVFVPMLIKAIQEQQEQIQELKNKLS